MDELIDAPPVRLDFPVLRATVARATTDKDQPKLEGHFSVFDNWFEINSMFEGHFIERTVAGSFKRTFDHFRAADRPTIHLMYEHGMDPTVGEKPLGEFVSLNEDRSGAAYSANLFDSGYVNDLLPALRSGLYGSSYRFQVIRDAWDYDPETSDHNPDGLPERTILEQRVFEAGPTLFPANPAATAQVRSATDWYYDEMRSRQPDMYDHYRSRAIALRTPLAGKSGTGLAKQTDDALEGTRRTPKDVRQMLRRLTT